MAEIFFPLSWKLMNDSYLISNLDMIQTEAGKWESH